MTLTLTPQAIQLMLDAYPEMLEAGEGEAGPAGAAAVYPAKFEVSGRDKIYEDTSLNTKNAGGRFSAAGINVLLNYTSVLGGISYENMAVWGTSHSRDIEAKLAVDAEYEAFGVYGGRMPGCLLSLPLPMACMAPPINTRVMGAILPILPVR